MSAEIISDHQNSLPNGFIILCAVILILLILHYWQQSTRLYKLGNKIPGLPSWPFIGNAFNQYGLSDHERIEEIKKISEKLGIKRIGRAFIGPYLLVFLADPNDIEVILSSSDHLEKSQEYKFFKPWLGDGLLISHGDKWLRDRKLIAPAFHQNVLKSFVEAFNRNSLNVVKKMSKEIGKEFDVHGYMSAVTVDTLLETAMGTKKPQETNDSYNYAMAVLKMCDIIHQRQLIFYLRPDFIFNFTKLKKMHENVLNIIHNFSSRVFELKKQEYQENLKNKNFRANVNSAVNHESSNNIKMESYIKLRDDIDEQDEQDIGEKRRLAFLDLMIETAQNNKEISDQEVKEQIDTIMFEGHDTLAAGSSFVLCLLGYHHDIQEKVYEEQKKIFGDSHRSVTFADVAEMKYLERVILETLRMCPPVPIIARQLNKDVRIVTNNYILPAGTSVIIATLWTHRDKEFFPDPDKFNPDNFLPERTQNRHFYSYIPFSAGPRSCVGRKYAMLKLKILLSTILRNYKIKSNVPESEFRYQADIILKREDGFRIEIEPRHV